MKFVSSICICLLFALPSIAQNRLIPAVVKSSFIKMYPFAKNESWDAFTLDFTASFSLESKSAKATFNKNGEWKRTTIESSFAQLPEAISASFFKSKYCEYKILKVNTLSTTEHLLLYELDIEGRFKERFRLQYQSDGQIVAIKSII